MIVTRSFLQSITLALSSTSSSSFSSSSSLHRIPNKHAFEPRYPKRIVHFHTCTPLRTTAYSGDPGLGIKGLDKISYLPIETHLPNGSKVQVTPFTKEDWPVGMELMNLIIREGKTWPFDTEFETMDAYRGYFLSHAAFVVRSMEPGRNVHNDETYTRGEIMGCFYIKPNFPGRCSHICNGGFITTPKFRKMGVAKVMGKSFLRLAKDLGYKSSYFNLVFKSNEASVRLWESLGFERVAVLENAAKLEGVEGLDTAYGYRYDLEKLPLDD